MAKTLYVVSYDVSCDRTRAQIDRLLQGFGLRVQKSVFECRLNRGEKARLQTKLAAHTGDGVDIRVYAVAYSNTGQAARSTPSGTGAVDYAFVL